MRTLIYKLLLNVLNKKSNNEGYEEIYLNNEYIYLDRRFGYIIRFKLESDDSKLRCVGIHAVTEIPTYPYDSEFNPHIWKQPLRFILDKCFRKNLYRHMDAVVTFSDATEIFGQHTINISNGVDLDSIPL